MLVLHDRLDCCPGVWTIMNVGGAASGFVGAKLTKGNKSGKIDYSTAASPSDLKNDDKFSNKIADIYLGLYVGCARHSKVPEV